MRLLRTALALLLGGAATSAPAAPQIGAGYGAGMVLQQGQPIMIAGRAQPRQPVTGELGGDRATAAADTDGRFTLSFPAREASDTPLELVLSDGSGTYHVAGLLIGDVYLCSGQSNMELPVERSLDVASQLRQADDAGMRLLKIPLATAPVPQGTFSEPVAWMEAKAETVAEFSAACYYMGKRLRAARPDVPIGLIHSNWGGSQARPWLSPESGEALYGRAEMDLLVQYERDPLAATRAFAPRWYDWWRERDGGREPWRDSASLSWQPVPQISFWNEWEGTGLDEQPLANVWLRREVELTAEQARAGATLSIGSIDDLDFTWVNGHPVGYTFGWGVERTYDVPAEYLRPGRNHILIAANNAWDTGGFFSTADRLFLAPRGGGAAIPLGDGWQFSIAPVEGTPPRAPWDVNAGIGVMHNAMIAPLGQMRLAGVAWYQGESDVGQAGYGERLRQLFAGWRRQFGSQARMLVVQLANYGKRESAPKPSGWADLRAVQLAAAATDTDARLVSAIDIGEPGDIHPANKNELGRRLALAAEGAPMPMPLAARRAGDTITVTFTGIEGPLRTYGGAEALGVEVCAAEQESCRFAEASADGEALRVEVPTGGAATRVRYAWADAPLVNLYDARDLPMPGFELPVEP